MINFKDKFVDIPNSLVQRPKTVEDYKNNAYYMIGSFFKSFTIEELKGLFIPMYFEVDEDGNEYFHISVSNNYFERFIYKNDEKTQYAIRSSKSNIGYKIEGCATVYYCLTTGKILFTLNEFIDNKLIGVLDCNNIEYYKNNINYHWMLNWYEYKPIALAKVEEICNMFDSYPFFYIHDLYSDKYRESKYDYSLVDILVSYNVIAGLVIEYEYKVFDASANAMYYELYPRSNHRYYNKKEKIVFDSLFKRPNRIDFFTDDFVKRCVAYHKKKHLRAQVKELNKDLRMDIENKEVELKRLKELLEYNKPAINKLKEEINSINHNDVAFNFNEYTKIIED